MKKIISVFLLISSLNVHAFGPQVVMIFEGLEPIDHQCKQDDYLKKGKAIIELCKKSLNQKKSYDVYRDTLSKVKIGKLEIIPKLDKGYQYFYTPKGLSRAEFNLENIDYECGQEAGYPYSMISKIGDGDYVSLANGPWGKQAWIMESHTDLLQSTLKFDFNDIESGSLIWNYDNKKFKLTGIDKKNPKYNELEPGDDTSKIQKSILVSESEMWSKEGTFLMYRYCGSL